MTLDLAIVGGGVLGCLAADEAARRHPEWTTAVLDSRAPGSGATSWSAAADFPLAATDGHRELVRASDDYWREAVGSPISRLVRRVPMIYVTARDRLAALEGRVVDRGLRPANRSELRRMAEILPDMVLVPDEVVVTHDEPGSVLPARAFVEALLTTGPAARTTEVHPGQHVLDIESADGVYRLRTPGVRWEARRVILAVGPWEAPAVNGRAVAAPPTRVKRVAALRSRLPVRVGDPLVYFLDDDLFVLPVARGVALISFYRDVWDVAPHGMDGSVDGSDLEEGLRALSARSRLAAEGVVGGQAFCDRYTEQRLPFVWTTGELPGLAAVLAGSGSGVRLGPGLARRAVHAVGREER
ncbi:FAD-binding oxidoreductase [Kitasatospora sp. SUK 42]|uniref:NAD(P)/FAD-dependent oxidoreductase n=1 Tax=Kitasatospora sp. SUK 42 TaxID=1588882 RepID=UPI0018CA6588|nr:FAD-binding oxidoreductase [Kitasatospora sp. SUK 42]MBV2153290.1 FAD-binding oxidoreductase [Kitasatospora sp. SUK 42]